MQYKQYSKKLTSNHYIFLTLYYVLRSSSFSFLSLSFNFFDTCLFFILRRELSVLQRCRIFFLKLIGNLSKKYSAALQDRQLTIRRKKSKQVEVLKKLKESERIERNRKLCCLTKNRLNIKDIKYVVIKYSQQ